MDFMGALPLQTFDLVFGALGRFVGRPLQRRRAKRLAARGKVNSVLFSPENPRVMRGRVVTGAAEVWEGRIRLWDADLWVNAVDLPGESGPNRERSDGDLLFRPPTRIFTLHTHRGAVKWAVLKWQADWALSQLGFDSSVGAQAD